VHQALAIAWKDLRHVYRSISGLAMMLVAPLLLAGAIGAAFGAGNNFSVPATKTVVVNQDSGAGGAAITSALTSPQLSDLLTVSQPATPEAARTAVDNGDAQVAVIIPAGLTQALTAANASPLQVEIYKDPTATVGPAIVSSVVQELVQSLNGARAAASATAQLAAIQGITDPGKLTALATQAAQAYSAAAQKGGTVALESRLPVTPGGAGLHRPGPGRRRDLS
jgi:ABC-2 type transport system permease protein